MFFHCIKVLLLIIIIQVIVNYCCFGGSDGIGEVGEGLELYLLDGAEAEKQVACAFGSDAGDVGEGGAEGAFGAFVAMVGDGKAMDFVLDLLEEMEERVGGLELDDFYFSPRFAEILEILEIFI